MAARACLLDYPEICCSADTTVATPSGEQAIGSLKVGDTVEAYNPTTGKAEPETVQHFWLNHDHDLVDVHVVPAGTPAREVVASTATAPVTPTHTGHGLLIGDDANSAVHLVTTQQAKTSTAAGETTHTTANHPWLTADRGWVPAGELRPGEPLVSLNGTTSTVAWVQATSGQADRYNLTVAHDHTYAVGSGQWVVHNSDGPCGAGTELSPADQVRAQVAEMKGAMSEGEQGRTTYGAAHVTTAEGTDEMWVSQAGREGYMRPGLRGDAINVRAPSDLDLPHINDAEMHLWRAAEARGATINALGATRRVCVWCQTRLPGSIPIVTELK